MPTYEYKCEACGHAFEKFQSMSAKPEKVCPACGKHKAKRLISAGAGLIFKGSGFYITDHRSKSYKESAKSDSASPATTTPAPSASKTPEPASTPASSPTSTPAGSSSASSSSKSSSNSTASSAK